MKRTLRILALALPVVLTVWWLAAGAHAGWTRTSVPRRTLDEVTGLEAVTYERRFVPGLDFLAAGAIAAASLFGASLLVRRHPVQNHR